MPLSILPCHIIVFLKLMWLPYYLLFNRWRCPNKSLCFLLPLLRGIFIHEDQILYSSSSFGMPHTFQLTFLTALMCCLGCAVSMLWQGIHILVMAVHNSLHLFWVKVCFFLQALKRKVWNTVSSASRSFSQVTSSHIQIWWLTFVSKYHWCQEVKVGRII